MASFTYFLQFCPPFVFVSYTVETEIKIHAYRMYNKIGNKWKKREKSCRLSLNHAIRFFLSLGIPGVTWLVEWPVIMQTPLLFLVFCMDWELSKWSFPFQRTWKRCIVILYACTSRVFVPAQPKQHWRYQESLPNHQEIFRQDFPVICLPVCQEMMEKIWKDLSPWVHYAGAPAAGLFLSVCILICET